MLAALIFLLEPSYTSLCGGCNAAAGCLVADGSALRSTWLYFPKYLLSCWIILSLPPCNYFTLCGRINVAASKQGFQETLQLQAKLLFLLKPGFFFSLQSLSRILQLREKQAQDYTQHGGAGQVQAWGAGPEI